MFFLKISTISSGLVSSLDTQKHRRHSVLRGLHTVKLADGSSLVTWHVHFLCLQLYKESWPHLWVSQQYYSHACFLEQSTYPRKVCILGSIIPLFLLRVTFVLKWNPWVMEGGPGREKKKGDWFLLLLKHPLNYSYSLLKSLSEFSF